ncbi:zinc metalloprotease family m13 neprilysin-related [Holotrichia oblita]|uniref:Zinc metalloprotease family m13 neprilysin-related n=1 Tax=Holotrichia oblita TaxID=644536 RepID=A0ACB9TV52_HOLOL|nr:zinc metalloprotease family m13 neprilysin-related [Holotrichia oblita]
MLAFAKKLKTGKRYDLDDLHLKHKKPHHQSKIPHELNTHSPEVTTEAQEQFNLLDINSSPEDVRRNQGTRMLKYMDTTEDPCRDFYQYACGNWHKYHPIPADHGGFDTFEMLRENLDFQLRRLLESETAEGAYNDRPISTDRPLETNELLPNHPMPTPYFEEVLRNPKTEYLDPIKKAKFLYKSCMKEDIINQRGAKPLLHLLSELRGWPILEKNWDASNFDFIWLVAQLRLYNNDILISEWIGPDIKNSDEYVIQIDQTSLGLPSRDYFLSETSREYIEAYHQFLLDIVYILGAPEDTAVDDVKDIIDFEIKLAMITADPEERRNLTNIYARLTLGELQAYVPQFDWLKYFDVVAEREVPISTPIVCYCMGYLQELINLLSKTPSRTIANYLLWRFVRHRVNNLDERFQNAKQKFYHLLFGREASPPRWQFCVAQVNSNLGMALGNLFVNAHFDEKSKNDTILMTKQLEDAFKEILVFSDWLDDVTKTIAIAKVDAMRLRIGYPDIILNRNMLTDRYKDIKIHPHYYFENSLSILMHLTRNEHVKIGKIVDKNMWNTAPAIVNAYYSRNKNQIMFPAGILQPPFYHQYFPRALNFGGIGVVIGHEITHGFDDKGRLFDKDGNLNTWWTEEATEKFRNKAKCIVEQYNSFVVPEVNTPLDGLTTQGENIADNGGLKQAYKAYLEWLERYNDHELPDLPLHSKQLFFLNFAQVWCGTSRPEAAKNRLKTAVHSPGRFRVIGTLRNSLDFANAFQCPPGCPMNPINKCTVW